MSNSAYQAISGGGEEGWVLKFYCIRKDSARFDN